MFENQNGANQLEIFFDLVLDKIYPEKYCHAILSMCLISSHRKLLLRNEMVPEMTLYRQIPDTINHRQTNTRQDTLAFVILGFVISCANHF